jgi:hypothetical protein
LLPPSLWGDLTPASNIKEPASWSKVLTGDVAPRKENKDDPDSAYRQDNTSKTRESFTSAAAASQSTSIRRFQPQIFADERGSIRVHLRLNSFYLTEISET